jgi:hypothetical protein
MKQFSSTCSTCLKDYGAGPALLTYCGPCACTSPVVQELMQHALPSDVSLVVWLRPVMRCVHTLQAIIDGLRDSVAEFAGVANLAV